MTADDAARTATSLHERALASGFSGVIRVDHGGAPVHEAGYGLADRAHGVACTPEHRFGLASIAKGFTALTVGSLVDEGRVALTTPVREVLGTDLPLVDDAVTVDHLLGHTSGIGDYIDEDAGGEITDHVLSRPVHLLDDVEAFLPELDGRPQVQAPGTGFAYNNSGYAVLAVVAQRVAGVPFADLVRERVLLPAGMSRTAFLRTDELPGDVARGYLGADGLRTNVLHLPVVATGDGGAYATAADLAAFWRALLGGDLVSPGTLAALTDARSVVEDEGMRYGAGFWRGLADDTLVLEGYDAGVSGRTWYDPVADVTATVLANWSDGAWPVLQPD